MKKQFNNPKNILVVRLGAMGDIIHVIPAVKCLKKNFPLVKITWLVEDKIKDLVETVAEVDEIVIFPRRRWQSYISYPHKYLKMLTEMVCFYRELRGRRYSLALDFHGNFKSGFLTFLSGTKIRIGFSRRYCKEFNYLFTNFRIKLQHKEIHRIEKYLALLQGMGLKAYYLRPVFSISEKDRDYIYDFIYQNQLENRPVAVIHPGTSAFGKYKQWAPENYACLADRLVKELGFAVVFTWGKQEYNVAKEIISYMQCRGIIACTTSVKQLITLLRHAEIYVGSDTGPTHLASSLGVPTIAIFGPKNPSVYAPYDKNSLVVRKEIYCSPCEKRTCDHITCIRSITPDEVFDAVCNLRKKRSLTF